MKNLLLMLSISVLLYSCGSEGDTSIGMGDTNEQVGKGGSTTKFAIVDHYLYIVEKSQLKTINISDPADPKEVDNITINDELETIFPYEYNGETVLLLGATNGMHVYQIGAEGKPNIGEAVVLAHQRSCDPVVAYDGYAYVTLRSSEVWGCSQGFNQLHAIALDLNDLSNLNKDPSPILMDGPKGLSLSDDGDALLVCDKNSLKIYSLFEDPANPAERNERSDIKCNDILQYKDQYIITGDNLLKVYSFDPMTYELKEEVNLLSL